MRRQDIARDRSKTNQVLQELLSQTQRLADCDALPWNGGLGANNWSLSAGRAEATRQAMLGHGIAETRFRKIEGVADREPLVRDNPQDPRNRRISILLMR